MGPAIDRFLSAVQQVDDGDQYKVIDLCCFALGIEYGPCHAVELDHVKNRLTELSQNGKICEAVVVIGLLDFMINYPDASATEAERLAKVDFVALQDFLKSALPLIAPNADASFVEEISIDDADANASAPEFVQ